MQELDLSGRHSQLDARTHRYEWVHFFVAVVPADATGRRRRQLNGDQHERPSKLSEKGVPHLNEWTRSEDHRARRFATDMNGALHEMPHFNASALHPSVSSSPFGDGDGLLVSLGPHLGV